MTALEDAMRQPQHPDPHQPIHPKKEKEPEPEEKPDKEKEPEEPKEEPEHATSVTMTAAQFREIMETVVKEARKPVVDEMVVARRKRTREHNQQLAKDQRTMLIQRFRNCNHMHMPGSVMTGCAAIAWATQSDGKRRGTCQHCGTIFSPVKEECLADEIWQSYSQLVRLPTHPAGNVNNIFMSA